MSATNEHVDGPISEQVDLDRIEAELAEVELMLKRLDQPND